MSLGVFFFPFTGDLRDFGLKLGLKPAENRIEVVKYYADEDIIVSFPYFMVSDTLQRIIFHLVAVESNRDSVLVFEEPEAHAFPYYTKFLAERIALDRLNQYFISTHNPYFLLSILEKTPMSDVRVFLTYLENMKTRVKALDEEDLTMILDREVDPFFNVGMFTGET